jgi:signal peptidase I
MQSSKKAKKPAQARSWYAALWQSWVKPILVVVIGLSTFRSAVADWNDVPTGSMKPTILEGDRIFVNKLAYDLKVPFTTWRLAKWSEPRRGDVIVFTSPVDGTNYVKRVIGVPGDEIALRDNRLFVNGKPAAYEPLSAAIRDQIPAAERPRHEFAQEQLGGKAHPVMLTPAQAQADNYGPVVVPPESYFVMGDNRDNSLDSRWFGFVERSRVLGKAEGVALSVNPSHHYQPRWQRFFSRLP